MAGENFWIICAASKQVSFCFPGASLYTQPQLACFEFIIEVNPEALYFPHNLLSTMWEDLSAAIAEKRVKVFNPADPQENSFRSLLYLFKDEAHACFRWTICTHEDLTFLLDLQGFLMSASTANRKQAFCLDTAPTIRLASLGLEFPLFPGDYHIPGPAPVIFSDDPDLSKALLTPQSPLLRYEIGRISWHLSTREYITVQEAKSFSSSPREGLFSRPVCAAINHHPKPSTSQEFHSTSQPADSAAGKIIGSDYLSSLRKYSIDLPTSFHSAMCSALSQQLSSPPDSILVLQAESQLAQSISSSTWKRHLSAWHSFNLFLSSHDIPLTWPLTLPILRQYTTWAHSSRHLHPHTIAAYLSSLNQIHQFLGFPDLQPRADFLNQSLLKGSGHSKFYDPPHPPTRRTITFSILKLLGHQIASPSWSYNSQLTVWTAALVAF
jgi:hypothetical protein